MIDPRPLLAGTTLLAALLAACSQPPAEPSFTPQDQADIEATTAAALAIVNGAQDWGEYADVYYAPDAVFLPPNAEAVIGRAAIVEFLASFPTITAASFDQVKLEGTGDVAYVYGTYHIEMTTPDGPATDDGKYLEIWRRQADGSWRITYDMFNSDLPAT